MKNQNPNRTVPVTHQSKPIPAQPSPKKLFDKKAFNKHLEDLIVMRWPKTSRFIRGYEEAEVIFGQCLAIREQGITKETSEILRRLSNSGGYLAAAGNWLEFLQVVGISTQQWNQIKSDFGAD